ncbi:hypothetical protein Airi02_011340 [Actinoallomurus iriomotensis]|uniref:Uncharacterized protein n=1 Tax=Actinoallomurus iriomotensis TaxID=478107 RepID=A0A9W6RXA2_9ACTN|nr:hypothetical protein Airi02_011340 [Actinoallomurus iriomotensis]
MGFVLRIQGQVAVGAPGPPAVHVLGPQIPHRATPLTCVPYKLRPSSLHSDPARGTGRHSQALRREDTVRVSDEDIRRIAELLLRRNSIDGEIARIIQPFWT